MFGTDTATVLIVDDQVETGYLMARILGCLGHHAVYVPSGPEALNFVHDTLPDAILLDYMMPGMDGLEVLRALRQDPRTQRVPVIIFSANSDPNVIDSAHQEGATDYWVKATIEVDDIEIRLKKWLAHPPN